MRYLLDTNLLLWAMEDSLSKYAMEILGKDDITLYFSTISIWEVGIKNNLGRADFKVDPKELYESLLMSGYEELVINANHTILASSLPLIHKDPFDRIIIAQSLSSGITLKTSDKILLDYSKNVEYLK